MGDRIKEDRKEVIRLQYKS